MLKYILSDKWFTFSRFQNQTENILSYQNSSEKKKGRKKFFPPLRYIEYNDRKIFRNKNFPTEIYILLDRNNIADKDSTDIFQEKIKTLD